MRGSMYKNRIRGGRGRTSEPHIAKSISVETTNVHSATVRRRLLGLPRESCIVSLKKACHDAGTDGRGKLVTALQQSAEGIVGSETSRDHPGHEARATKTVETLPKARTVPLREGAGEWCGE